MLFILGATASDDASEFACDYAVVELTPELAQKILARMDALTMLYSRDCSLHEFDFWDTEVRFYHREFDDGLDAYMPRDASQYVAATDPRAAATGSPLWTECEHMVVAVGCPEPEVYWRARAKHSALRMETCSLPMAEIARTASGAVERQMQCG